jgi:hypothetical protein
MANASTAGRMYRLDTIGLIATAALRIMKARLFPNAAGDTATLKTYNEGGTAHSTAAAATTTIAATNLIQSTGKFTAAKVTAGDVIRIFASDGAAANIGLWYVVSRDSDDQITVSNAAGGSMTNEIGSKMTWAIYSPDLEFTLKAEGTTGAKVNDEIDFGPRGRQMRNLLLTTLASSAVVEILLPDASDPMY